MMLCLTYVFIFSLLHCTFSTFLAGVDISHVVLFEKHGVIYRDYDNQPIDPFRLFKKYGINIIRLRLFTSSEQQAENNPMDYAQTLNYTLNLALRAKRNDLPILLDFHYSDSWVDPGKQSKPSRWINMTFEQLKQQFYEYTRDTIKAFFRQNTLPDYIQIGDEINNGIVWPDGNVSDWKKFGALLRAGIEGVRDVSQKPKIILHITSAANWTKTNGFFDQAIIENVNFDIIAQSYYPFWHGSINDVRQCLIKTAERYKKPIIIMETAFPWVSEDPSKDDSVKLMTGFEGGPQGQVDFVKALARMLKELPNDREAGIFWWDTEYQFIKQYPNLGGFDLRSFFNQTGYPFPILREFGKLSDEKKNVSPILIKLDIWPAISGIVGFIILAFIFTIKSIRRYSKKKISVHEEAQNPLLEEQKAENPLLEEEQTTSDV